jgi:hypothetical protein
LKAAQRGYSILDTKIFIDKPHGTITEKHIYLDNTPISKKYEINLLGRHQEIHELLKFLSNKRDDDGIEKVYFIHDNE